MKKRSLKTALAAGPLVVFAIGCAAVQAQTSPAKQTAPMVRLQNDRIAIEVELPDAEHGQYRGPRMDWTGMVSRVDFNGHRIFGQWKGPTTKPLRPGSPDDTMVGTAEEFGTTSPPGYDSAKPGESFVKIGVGLLEKSRSNGEYRFSNPYHLNQPDVFKVKCATDAVEVSQTINDGRGVRLRYTKRIELTTPAGFRITRTLDNDGAASLVTDHYGHNLFSFDDRSTDSAMSVSLPASMTTAAAQHPRSADLLPIEGDVIHVARAFTSDDNAFVPLNPPADQKQPGVRRRWFTITNRESRVAVRVDGDLPLSRLTLYATKEVLCPEPFVELNIPPQTSLTWSTWYDFDVEH